MTSKYEIATPHIKNSKKASKCSRYSTMYQQDIKQHHFSSILFTSKHNNIPLLFVKKKNNRKKIISLPR